MRPTSCSARCDAREHRLVMPGVGVPHVIFQNGVIQASGIQLKSRLTSSAQCIPARGMQ